MRGAIQKAVVVGSYLIMPTALLVAVAAEPLVALLLTEKWLACVLVFQLVCVQNLGLMLGIVNLRAYMALGHSGLYLKLQLIKVLSGLVIISGIAILLHNIYWVALAACVHGLLCVFIDLAPAKRMHLAGVIIADTKCNAHFVRCSFSCWTSARSPCIRYFLCASASFADRHLRWCLSCLFSCFQIAWFARMLYDFV